MKQSVLIWVFVAMLAACGRTSVETVHTPSPQLSAIDSLMWQQPDSALTLLLAFAESPEADSLDGFNGHYFQLLVSELLYKNDYGQTNREDLLKAVAYFDTIDNAFLDARAHYINGVGFYEKDSVVEACTEYLKALEVMEEHYDEKELVGLKAQFMALTHTHLCGLFSDQYLHEQAIYFGKQSLLYYHQYNAELLHVAWILDELGLNYNMLNQSDSAFVYFGKALEVLPDTNNLTYRDIVAIQTYLRYLNEKDAENTLKRLSALCLNSESDHERYARYAIIGDVYYREKSYDSAWLFLDTVFCFSSNISLKKQAAELLSKLCELQEKDSELLLYASFLVPFANQEENQSMIKSQLTEYYNVFRQTSIERTHRQSINKNASRYATLLLLFSIVAIVLLFVYRKSKKREQNLEDRFTAERRAHRMQMAALSGRLKCSNQKVLDMTKLINQQSEHETVHQETGANSFEEEPICRLIMDRVSKGQFKAQMDCSMYKPYALDREQLLELRKVADRHFDNYTKRLKKQYPKLTDADLDYCNLYLLGLTTADLSALMQRAYNTVNERNKKLKGLFALSGSLVLFLRSFADNDATV